jgi:uncharacterized membrane protein HdeD (DUF308 family)
MKNKFKTSNPPVFAIIGFILFLLAIFLLFVRSTTISTTLMCLGLCFGIFGFIFCLIEFLKKRNNVAIVGLILNILIILIYIYYLFVYS